MNRWDLSVWMWHKNKTILYWFFSLDIVLFAQLWDTGRAVNTIDRKQSKAWERFCSPGLWKSGICLAAGGHCQTLLASVSASDTRGGGGGFSSSMKVHLSPRSHIYSFLKRFLLILGLLSVRGASWVLWSMAPWTLPCSPLNWSWSIEKGAVWHWRTPSISPQSPSTCLTEGNSAHWKCSPVSWKMCLNTSQAGLRAIKSIYDIALWIESKLKIFPGLCPTFEFVIGAQ